MNSPLVTIDGIIYAIQAHGGISVYFNNILREFSVLGLGYEVLVFGGRPSGLPDVAKVVARKPRVLERYRAIRLSSRGGVFHSSYYRVPDVRDHATRIVTTVHDFVYERTVNGPRRWVHSSQKQRAILSADAIICVSHATRADLDRFVPGIAPDRVHVIPHGVDPCFRPLSRGVRARAALFVGGRYGYKNFVQAVRALAEVGNHEMWLVGGGAPTRGETRHLDRHLAGRWKWFGSPTADELNVIYNAAAFLLYPSSLEGFGLPILEAYSAGCPVLVVDASWSREVASTAAVYAEGTSWRQLADAIQRITRRDSGRDLVAEGMQIAGAYSWQKAARATATVYSHLVERPLVPFV